MQSLGALKPAFKDMGETMPGFDAVAILKYPHLERINHVHHAGNSSGIVDGAAARPDRLQGLRREARPHAPRPHPRHRQGRHRPHDHADRPRPRRPRRSCATPAWTIGDLDLFEVNEAFSAVVLRFLQAFGADPARVNVNGGAIAMGHPLGATGAMILGTALDELERSGKETAPRHPLRRQRHGRRHDHRAGVMDASTRLRSRVTAGRDSRSRLRHLQRSLRRGGACRLDGDRQPSSAASLVDHARNEHPPALARG